MVTFENPRTIEQVKADTKSSKLFMYPAYEGHGTDKHPLTYKDANGADTGVQKYTVENEAGITIGWCNMAVARDLAAGKLDKSRLVFKDSIDSESGIVYTNKLMYNNQREGGVEL